MSNRDPKVVLNVGSRALGWVDAHPVFAAAKWREARVDCDPSGTGRGSIADLRAVAGDGGVDAVWSSHMVQRLYAHEVIPAFREMRRVLASDGFALVTCPDMTQIAAMAADGDIEKIVYNSAAGPIRVIDMIFGHGRSIGEGRLGMAHRTGFSEGRLGRLALEAGFAEVRVMEGPNYDIWAALLTPGADASYLARMFAGTNVAELFDAA